MGGTRELTLPSEKATCETSTSASAQMRRVLGQSGERTANLRGLMARSGRPIKNETTKHAAAPAMQRRNPTKRSHRERAK